MITEIRCYCCCGHEIIRCEGIQAEDSKPLRIRTSQLTPCGLLDLLPCGTGFGCSMAVAWPRDEAILLGLCYPIGDDRASDRIFLDEGNPPRIILKVPSWEDVPVAARLLQAAFGRYSWTPAKHYLDLCCHHGHFGNRSCAHQLSAKEQEEARRMLGEWLIEHEQPETAKDVEHLSSFPFSPQSGSSEVVTLWKNIRLWGEEQALDSFAMIANPRFELLGWKRDESWEHQLHRDAKLANQHSCWIGNQACWKGIALSLNRTSTRRMRGSTFKWDAGFEPTIGELEYAIQIVLSEVLEPVAKQSNLEIAYPRLGPISQIGTKTLAALAEFASAGDGRWPISPARAPELEHLWKKLMRAAFEEDVALDPGELTAWFADSGWNKKAAEKLAKRFYADAARLSEQEPVGQVV